MNGDFTSDRILLVNGDFMSDRILLVNGDFMSDRVVDLLVGKENGILRNPPVKSHLNYN